jgi:hypothetical protein
MNASWVAIDLMEFAVRTEDAVQSPEAALEWLRSFRDTLLMEGRNSRPMPWAVELLGMADVKIAKKSIARMQGQIVKIYGKDCDVDLECSKKYGEKYEKLKNIIAAATTSDGVDVSANGCDQLTADAPTREDGDERQHPSDGELLESGTSANHYDQEPYQVSTDEARQSQRAGENSVRRVEKVSTSPVRSSGPAKHQHGEFGNVMLTTDEYIKLCEKCQDADSLITELDQYIESQGKGKKYKSHYATLLNWSRRKASESKPQQRYKNFEEQNRENIAQIQRDLRLMFHPEEVESL